MEIKGLLVFRFSDQGICRELMVVTGLLSPGGMGVQSFWQKCTVVQREGTALLNTFKQTFFKDKPDYQESPSAVLLV